MSVLNRKELEDSPLADLHQIASELGLEDYRSKRKADLIGAILGIVTTGAAAMTTRAVRANRSVIEPSNDTGAQRRVSTNAL